MDEEKFIIAIDIDGTLLNKYYQIPLKTSLFLSSLVKKGHIVILASGRPYRAIKEYYHELKLNTPVISYNGALLLSPFSDLGSIAYPFHKETVISVYNDLRDYVTNILAEVENNIYISEDDIELKKYFPRDEMNIKVGEFSEILDSNPMAVVMKLNEEGIKNHDIVRSIISKYDNLEGRIWTRVPYVELFYRGVDKGIQLKKIKEYYGIDSDHVIAIGDSENDIGMFKEAKYKIAMINGKDSIKKEANIITKKDNNHGGLVDPIKDIFEGKIIL